MKIKERCVQNESEYPQEAPRLFFQNALVDEYNTKAYESSHGNKYTITAHDTHKLDKRAANFIAHS